MTCYYPLPAWYKDDPNPDTGKYSLKFAKKGTQLEYDLCVPCGKCIGCKSDQARDWAIRCYHESAMHPVNSFLTLTYDDQIALEKNYYLDKIDKKHLQDFFKRMRKNGHKLRYFACGEYGEKTKRPHYHALIFGQDFLDDSTPIGGGMYTNRTIERIWGWGQMAIKSVNADACAYVAGYCNKKIGDEDTFALQSRKPPIGSNWLRQWSDDIARTGIVVINGRELVVPKRYLEWGGLELDHVAAARRPTNYTHAQLRAKEINHKARLKQKAEKI